MLTTLSFLLPRRLGNWHEGEWRCGDGWACRVDVNERISLPTYLPSHPSLSHCRIMERPSVRPSSSLPHVVASTWSSSLLHASSLRSYLPIDTTKSAPYPTSTHRSLLSLCLRDTACLLATLHANTYLCYLFRANAMEKIIGRLNVVCV
jgi:hypothetical protein